MVSVSLCVVGGTPAGIAMAVRAAREGLDVLLVHHFQRLGGLPANGLGVWDTLYEGRRSPIYDELRQTIFDYYRETYGSDSPQYRDCLPAPGHGNGKFEPGVFERLVERMVGDEPAITVWRGLIPTHVDRKGQTLDSVTFGQFPEGAGPEMRVKAAVFADCTYEGDLLALAGAHYRVGRESRGEFDEPHAGHIIMRRRPDLSHRRATPLALRLLGQRQEIVAAHSTGNGDGIVQAANYRLMITQDPANRRLPDRPANYDAAELAAYLAREVDSGVTGVPNQKRSWNRPQLIGPHAAYPEASWPERLRIAAVFREKAETLLWYLQNDPTVRASTRERWQDWGFARDEFTSNDGWPDEMYVREARRLIGRYVMREQDFMLDPATGRTPIHRDSIAFTDWYIDVHACTEDRVEGGLLEGKMMLDAETMPAQVPYRSLLPKEIDNLLVPVCLSCTHVAWGAIRLEPTWMHIGESAGYAAALAVEKGTAPAGIDTRQLQHRLATAGVALSFFNDLGFGETPPWAPAAHILAAQGFFPGYDVAAHAPLATAEARLWADAIAALRAGCHDPRKLAADLHAARLGSHLASGTAQALSSALGDASASEHPILRATAIERTGELVVSRTAGCAECSTG